MQPEKNRAYVPEKTYELPDLEPSGPPKQVLLLEDDVELARNLKELLEVSGFRVTWVINGAAGLREMMSTTFDAIVCDMVMPNFPGDMFYLAVQRSQPQMCRRFIFTTGHRADPKIDQFIRQVKGLMLWKPFQPHELLDALKVVMRKAESET